jgi:LacI family transcriptional regulator
LIDLGHTKIAHVSGPLAHEDAFKRRSGYVRALEEAKIEVDEGLMFEGDYLEQSGLMAMSALLARGKLFTAVFVGGDLMAQGVRLGLHRQGLRVPEDISLLGFDDMRGTKYFIPPLTTIRQPMAEYGVAAAQISLDLLQGQPISLPCFQPELVRRESLAPLGSVRFVFERSAADFQNSTRAD